MTINLDEIERIAREATPGPWRVSPEPRREGAMVQHHDGRYGPCDLVRKYPEFEFDIPFLAKSDAKHIATMNPATTLELLAELRTARSRIAELEAQCAKHDRMWTQLLENPEAEAWCDSIEMDLHTEAARARHRAREGK